MPAHVALASLLAAVAPQQAAPLTTLSFAVPSQLVLDGRHYALPSGGVELRADGHYYVLATLAMADCARPGNVAQVATPNALRWAGGLRTVYLSAPAEQPPVALRYVGGEWQFVARSATGDVACAGEVMPTGVLFRSDFE